MADKLHVENYQRVSKSSQKHFTYKRKCLKTMKSVFSCFLLFSVASAAIGTSRKLSCPNVCIQFFRLYRCALIRFLMPTQLQKLFSFFEKKQREFLFV